MERPEGAFEGALGGSVGLGPQPFEGLGLKQARHAGNLRGAPRLDVRPRDQRDSGSGERD